MIMNVTPAEFKDIWDVCNAVDGGWMNVADFEHYMRMYYGCKLRTTYKLVVRRDVPCIPMYSQNINRFEHES